MECILAGRRGEQGERGATGSVGPVGPRGESGPPAQIRAVTSKTGLEYPYLEIYWNGFGDDLTWYDETGHATNRSFYLKF